MVCRRKLTTILSLLRGRHGRTKECRIPSERGHSLSKPSWIRLAAATLVFACLVLLASGEVGADEAPATRTESDVIGASIAYPEEWVVEREQYTYDGTYGFTLWKPDSGAAHDHGGTPAVRVALAYGLGPGQIEATVREKLAAYPDLPMQREEVSVAEKGHRGVAVGPIPGSTPSTEVYAPVNGRVYQIDVYGEGLGADGEELLSTLRFEPPSRSVRSLGLPDANAPEALYEAGDPELDALEREAREEEPTFSAASGSETRIGEGCWRADPDFFVQTQQGRYANGNPNDGIPTGYARVGQPNYWGEYTHGNIGMGRCTARHYTNDKFAVDFLLNRGDYVYSPFNCGKVTFAGRDKSYANYGIFVAIRACNGKYASLSAHLKGLHRRLEKGDRVDRLTVLGYAGNTSFGDIPAGEVHLHQAYYRYPTYGPKGAPYGGAGLQMVRHRYFRGHGGVYTFGWERTRTTVAKDSLVSN